MIALTEDILQLINQRELLRQQGQYKEADEIREILQQSGVIVQDSKYGTQIDDKTGWFWCGGFCAKR